jgi:hypothetical protein
MWPFKEEDMLTRLKLEVKKKDDTLYHLTSAKVEKELGEVTKLITLREVANEWKKYVLYKAVDKEIFKIYKNQNEALPKKGSKDHTGTSVQSRSSFIKRC